MMSSPRFQRRSLSGYGIAVLACMLVAYSLPSSSQPLAAGHSKFLGGSTSTPVWSKFNLYWNQVTPGNDGKWGSVEGNQGQFNWINLDAIYNYAISNSILFKEHNLVWGSQQPAWITGLDSAHQYAEVATWIDTVAQRYPSASLVDVVNEPFHSPPPYRNALGGNGATGWDWVITAFQLARQSFFRGVKLILNDYNILQDDGVTTNYINLVTLLKNRGLIDGIGIQGHYFEFRSPVGATSNVYVYNLGVIKANLDRIAQLGLPIYITEFDVDEPVDSNQAAQYKVYFPVFWTHPAVKGMTLWGYIQNDVWDQHPNTYLLHSDGTERPALRWLRNFIALPFPPVIISPSGTIGEPRNTMLVWHASATALSYRVQLSSTSDFSTVLVDSTVADTTLHLQALSADASFSWRVSASNDSGASAFSDAAPFTTGDQILAVTESGGPPVDFSLSQNYPNPFNPTTQIGYTVRRSAFLTLIVYDLTGSMVATLFEGVREPGTYTATFDGKDLSSGVYFYRLRAAGLTMTRKLVLVK